MTIQFYAPLKEDNLSASMNLIPKSPAVIYVGVFHCYSITLISTYVAMYVFLICCTALVYKLLLDIRNTTIAYTIYIIEVVLYLSILPTFICLDMYIIIAM